MIEDAERIRQLEKDQATLTARVESIDRQQVAQWKEFRGLEERHTQALKELRAEQKQDFDALMTAINANKLAWKMMDSGTKTAAWIILALASVAGAVAGVASAIRRFVG